MSDRIPNIVIVGRPNVGKSTLFNRLFGRKRALVHDLPGVTRDRLELKSVLKSGGREREVSLIDTGGLEGERFSDEIESQVRTALEKADILLFVLDAMEGPHPDDEVIFKKLRRSGVLDRATVIGVFNKIDHDSHSDRVYAFDRFHFERWAGLSAEHGTGVEDLKEMLLDAILESGLTLNVSEEKDEEEEPAERVSRTPRITIVGRPNVGKSTLTNFLLGEERMITSPVAGTTVDHVDVEVQLNGKSVVLVDTAGIRRKDRTEKGVEVLSVIQTRKALESADVALLVLDAEQGPIDQDEKIGGLIEECGCSVVILLNKWDLHARSGFTQEDARERVFKQMAFLRFAPIVFASAKKGAGLEHLGDLIEEILEQRKLRLQTKELTDWIRDESRIHNPLEAKFYTFQQTGRHPPSFTAFVNDPAKIHFSLKRHLINAMRERWGYMGTPIRMHFIKARNTGSTNDD